MTCSRISLLRLVFLLATAGVICHANDESPAPTPNIHPIPIHPHATSHESESPTPTISAKPTHPPHVHPHSAAPSMAPHKKHDDDDKSHPPSMSPTAAPTPTKHATTTAPTPVLPPVPAPTNEISLLRILAKTLAWCILLALSVLLFGAIMSHRYRILYFCKGLWLVIMRLQCTQTLLLRLSQCTDWIMERLPWRRSSRGGGNGGAGGLNTILFSSSEDDAAHYYNEMREGLLHGDD